MIGLDYTMPILDWTGPILGLGKSPILLRNPVFVDEKPGF
jgi:hypothetical protein